jgi:hypothetical protein
MDGLRHGVLSLAMVNHDLSKAGRAEARRMMSRLKVSGVVGWTSSPWGRRVNRGTNVGESSPECDEKDALGEEIPGLRACPPMAIHAHELHCLCEGPHNVILRLTVEGYTIGIFKASQEGFRGQEAGNGPSDCRIHALRTRHGVWTAVYPVASAPGQPIDAGHTPDGADFGRRRGCAGELF